jgi:tetratricopeptide (TPR) repeat protein
MSTYKKYLPHLSVTAFIVFLATDYFPLGQKPGSLYSAKSLSMEEGSHKEGKHNKGNNGEIENLSQEQREHRMAIFHYNEGNKFYNEENYSEAIIRYEKALHHNKKFKEVLINLSTAYMKNKVLDKALKTIKAGQNQFPQEALFDYNFACYYSLRKNLAPGLSALKQAVAKGFNQFKQIEKDSDLIYLRQSDEYKTWKEKMLSTRTT